MNSNKINKINRIIIFGANGMLGSYLTSYLSKKYNVITICRSDYDIMLNTYDDLRALLTKYNTGPDTLVINATGTIPQAASKTYELNDKIYMEINAIFPNILSSMVNKMGAECIHSTTDCVYDGIKGNYVESDVSNAITTYGKTKSLGEPADATVIRTSIIGEELNNKRSLLEWVRSMANKQINGFNNHIWNGITCLQYAKCIDTIIQKKLFWKGVRHLHSPSTVSKYQLVSMINQIYNLNIDIQKHNDNIGCDRSLMSQYPEFVNIFQIPELETQIIEMAKYDLSKCLPINKYINLTPNNHPKHYNHLIMNLKTIFRARDIVKNIDPEYYDLTIINNQNNDNLEFDISIVMTTYNRSTQTYFTLKTIRESSCPKNIQIIIVDDSNTDLLDHELLSKYNLCIYHIKTKNKFWFNPCINYNLGFEFIKAPKVIIQNSEVCHIGDIIQHVDDHLLNDQYMVFDVSSLPNQYANNLLYQIDHSYNNYNHMAQMFSIWYQHHSTRNRQFHFLTAITYDTLKKVGGFDYDFSMGSWYDDDEFIYRIRSMNIGVINVPNDKYKIMGIHQWHVTSGSDWDRGTISNDKLLELKRKYYGKYGIFFDLTKFDRDVAYDRVIELFN